MRVAVSASKLRDCVSFCLRRPAASANRLSRAAVLNCKSETKHVGGGAFNVVRGKSSPGTRHKSAHFLVALKAAERFLFQQQMADLILI